MKIRKPTELPASLKHVNIKAVLRKHGIYTQQRFNKDIKEQALPLARQMLKKKAQKPEARIHPQFSNEEIISYGQRQIRLIEYVENQFEKKLEQFISKIVRDFLLHLETEISEKALKKFEAKGFFTDNADEFATQAQLDFTPLLTSQATLAGQEALKLTGSKDVYIPYKYRDKIASNVTKFTDSLIDTDKSHLSDIINSAVKEGKSIPEIRGIIEADFDEYSKMQAERIARTEVARTSTQASIDAYEQSGVVEGKQWVIFGATDECADYDGEIVSDLHGNFYSGTDEFKDGDPPLHPNCKCQVIPIVIGAKGLVPAENKELRNRIQELEAQIDKRTRAYKEIKSQSSDDKAYIKSLEKHLGVSDEQDG